MEKTKESRINVFIIRSRSKRNETKGGKNELSTGFIYLLSYLNLDEIIKRETCPFPLHPSRGRVMEISRGRLVPFQDRIISSLQNSQIAYATFVGSLQ